MAAARQALRRLVAPLVAASAATVFLAPYLIEHLAREQATACLARYAAPRGPEPPDCRTAEAWLTLPLRLPWTATNAALSAEEIRARVAIAGYRDASIGRPDPARRDAAARALSEAAEDVENGSGRLVFSELGPSLGAPSVGVEAALAGDRRRLVDREGDWIAWPTRLAALEGALREGDLASAEKIAAHYAHWGPRDEDLRTAIAVTLCVGGAPKQGGELLRLVQDDRARDRHAAVSRDWGAERAAVVACADLAGVEAPPLPEGDAGRGDRYDVRVAMAMRIVADRGDDLTEAAQAAQGLLRDRLHHKRSRAALLAVEMAHYATAMPLHGASWAHARESDGEPPIVDPRPMTAQRAASTAPGLAPVARVDDFEVGSRRLLWLEREARRDGEVPAAHVLKDAAGALLIVGGETLAMSADPSARARALDLLDRGGALVGRGDAAQALARSTAAYLMGDAEAALVAIDQALAGARADDAWRVEALVQRAEVLASLGRRDEAAAAAIVADEQAAPGADTGVLSHARWTRIALAPPAAAGAPPVFAWVGHASPAHDLGEAWQRALFDRTTAAWSAALAAPPDDRRSLRYAVLALRGDAPPSLTAYLAVAARLADGAGDIETWLDAFSSRDVPRFTMRGHAWSRAQAARWRGDTEAADLWTKRHRTLGALAIDARRAELALYLGL